MPRGSVPTRCVRCGCALVASHINPVPEGMRKHSGRGLCSACHKADMRGVEREPETTGAQFHDQPWAADALCAEIGGDLWFPEKDSTGEPGQSHVREAKAICARCPVRTDCLQWALETDQRYGLWGGVSPRERAKMTPPAATGTDGPSYDATDQAVEQTEQPAPRSYGLAYIGGAHAHRPIPLATDIGVRPTHKPKTRKPTGLDWSKHTAPEPEKPATQAVEQVLRCRWCRQPADTLVDDVCDGCRHDAEQQFHAPDNTQLGRELAELERTDPKVAAAAASYDAMVERITRPEDHIQAPAESDIPANNIPASVTPGLDVVDYCARLLRDTATSSDPLVQILRGSALSVLAALDHAHHPTETPVAVPSSTRETATGPNKPSRRPANRTHNGPQRLQLPADTVDRYQAGTSTTQLAADLGVSIPTIRRWLLEHGVQLRAARVDYSPELVEAVRTRYHDQHMTQGEIATDLDVSTKVVQTAMNLAGIDRREAKARVAADNARGLKARIAALGVTSRDIKTWALAHGLVDQIARGLPGTALVDAYAEAHPPTRKENQPA